MRHSPCQTDYPTTSFLGALVPAGLSLLVPNRIPAVSSGNWPSQRHASATGFFDCRGNLKAEAIGEARQKVENPDDVPDLEQLAVAEAKVTQRLPVLARHPRRRCAHFFGHVTERTDARS